MKKLLMFTTTICLLQTYVHASLNLEKLVLSSSDDLITVEIIPAGGQSPYLFKKDDGDYQHTNVFTLIHKPHTSCTFTIQDSSAATKHAHIYFGDLACPSCTVSITQPTYLDEHEGIISLDSTQDISFSLNNGTPRTNSIIDKLAVGIHNLELTSNSDQKLHARVSIELDAVYNEEKMAGVKFTDSAMIHSLYQHMKDVHEVFEAYGIQYWIDSGTLLGAVRHRGIIPWDNDIDLCIAASDEQKLLSLEPVFHKLGWYLSQRRYGWKIVAPGGCDCDIFLTSVTDNKIIYADDVTSTYFAKRDGGPIYYTTDELFPLKYYQYGDLLVWGPHNPYPYLNNYYKDWQTIAKFLLNHDINLYSSKIVRLTDKEKQAAQPFGPLVDRFTESIRMEFLL